MEIMNFFGYCLLLNIFLSNLSYSMVDGEIRLRDMLQEKDKKALFTKKLKKASSTDDLKEFIKQVDKSGALRKIIRKLHIPKDSSLSLSTQVSRPNIFPNIFNQEDGFIVDAVIEWPLWLDLHAFAEAMHNDTLLNELLPNHNHGKPGWTGGTGENESKSDLDDEAVAQNEERKEGQEEENEDDVFFMGPPVLGGDEDEEEQFMGKSMSGLSGIVGLERCHIYEKIETGMSVYLDISRNQSRDCVLRAVCESQLLADFYPDAPSSIFFEVIHLILKPSLGANDSCFEKYIEAERAAYEGPEHCSKYISQCPLNIAGLFVRNFFPEIL